MADEEREKRRRGRRRGRGDAHRRPIEQRDEAPRAEEPETPAAAEAPAPEAPSGRTFRFGRRDKDDGSRAKERGRGGEKSSASSASAGNVSPMDFWRSGSPRAYRPAQPVVVTGPRWLRRITGFYLPPWAPVVGIIVVVFGILGFLFIVRSATGAPRIGDHWHAPFQFFVCGEKQPNARTWESGVHTHADGIMHIHPFQTYEEGSGARMVKWFEYGGGKLTTTSINMPGSGRTWKNGDTCPDGTAGEVQVFVTRVGASTEERLEGSDLTRFIPHDGDRTRFVFGPPEEIIQAEDHTVIPEEQAARTIEMTVTDENGSEPSTKFEPNSVEVSQGEVVKLVIKNTGTISHGFRVSGADGEYGTPDDFLVTPDGEDAEATGGILQPGAQGSAIIRLDVVKEVEFKDETTVATGTIVVRKSEAATPSPTPKDEEQVDVEFDLTMTDNVFSQTEFTVKAGEKFRFNLKNDGAFVHSMRIAGPDGEFDTDDDIVHDPRSIKPKSNGELVGQIDEEGTYPFRCDFHPTEMKGTIVVE